MDASHKPAAQSVSLFLRTDGTLLLVRGDQTVEIRLTPSQLIDLGVDALHVGLQLDDSLTLTAARGVFGVGQPDPLTDSPCLQQH